MRRGWKLIHVLALLGSIGIVVGIMFPVAGHARVKMQQNDCLSNIKCFHLGLIMYASDHNEMYPPNQPGAVSWASAILPYCGNSQEFLCPSDPVLTGSIVFPDAGPVTHSSYGRNSYMGTPGLSDREIIYPAQMLGCMDAVSYSIPYDASLVSVRAHITPDGTAATARHLGGCNQSYMDGHVKWIPFEDIPDPAGGKPPAKSPDKHYWQGRD